MVEHIGCFIYESLIVVGYSLDDCFQSFFAHFLCHAVAAILEEGSGVASFGHLLVAFLDESVQMVANRGDLISDVWIDLIGVFIGAAVGCTIWKIVSLMKAHMRNRRREMT